MYAVFDRSKEKAFLLWFQDLKDSRILRSKAVQHDAAPTGIKIILSHVFLCEAIRSYFIAQGKSRRSIQREEYLLRVIINA